jgi:phenylacetate-CoA ligase
MPNAYKERFGMELPGPPYWNEKVETLPWNEVVKLNEKMLRAEIRYVWERSPFYRRKLEQARLTPDDIKTMEDLQKIPFTTKDELRRSLDEAPPYGLHVCAPRDRIIRVHASSGTTGRPTFQCLTKHDREVWTELVSRVFWAHGIRPGDTIAFGFNLALFVGGLPLKDACENIGATFLPIGVGQSDRLLDLAKTIGANVLSATPSYALYLAEYARRKGIEPSEVGIRKIESGAEPGIGIPAIRKKIEDEWNAVAFEGLGNADAAPIIFGECPWQSGMHYLGQGIILPELIDPSTEEAIELEEGVEGELVYTTIDREASPVIRFRTGDHVKVWTEPCECGRTSFRVRCFGRTDDMLKVKGVKLWPSAVRDVVASFAPRVTGNIQIVVPKDLPTFAVQELKVEVEYSEKVHKDELPKLRAEIEEACASRLFVRPNIILIPPGTLPRFEHKAKLIRKE